MPKFLASNLILPTFKKDAIYSSISQELLFRAGFVMQSSAGVYNFLPLGLKTMQNLEKIIDQELSFIGINLNWKKGCQKVALGTILAADDWKKTGRWSSMGSEVKQD